MGLRFNLFRTDRRTAASFLALSLCTAAAAACSQPDDDEVGAARLAITQVPADTRCIRITVTGTRQVTRAFTVTPGASATLALGQLPLGLATFSGEAFPAVCSQVGSASVPGWVSDPVQAVVTVSPPVEVVLLMRRNGRGSVSVDFVDDPSPFATAFSSSGDIDRWIVGNGLPTMSKLWDATEGDPAPGSLAFRIVGGSSGGFGSIVFAILPVGVDLSGKTVRARVRLDQGTSVTAAVLLASSGAEADPPQSLMLSSFVALSPGVWTTVSLAVNNPADTFPGFDVHGVLTLAVLLRTTAPDEVWGHLDTVVVE
jgi:hypothetical protein